MLLAGEVSLTTISLVSKVITSENKAELLPKLRGASRSDVEKLLASMQGGGREIRDRVRPVAGKAVAKQGVTTADSQGSLGQVAKETEKRTEQGTEQSTARTSSSGGGFDTGNALQQSDTEAQRYEIRCAVSAEVRDKLERRDRGTRCSSLSCLSHNSIPRSIRTAIKVKDHILSLIHI